MFLLITLSICTVKCCVVSHTGWIWAVSIRLHVDTSRNTYWLSSIGSNICAHTITLLLPCLTNDVMCFQLWNIPLLLHTFFSNQSGSISPWFLLSKMFIFQKCSFSCFLAKSNLAFLIRKVSLSQLFNFFWVSEKGELCCN